MAWGDVLRDLLSPNFESALKQIGPATRTSSTATVAAALTTLSELPLLFRTRKEIVLEMHYLILLFIPSSGKRNEKTTECSKGRLEKLNPLRTFTGAPPRELIIQCERSPMNSAFGDTSNLLEYSGLKKRTLTYWRSIWRHANTPTRSLISARSSRSVSLSRCYRTKKQLLRKRWGLLQTWEWTRTWLSISEWLFLYH